MIMGNLTTGKPAKFLHYFVGKIFLLFVVLQLFLNLRKVLLFDSLA
jgi:hypothetical protein